MNFKKGYTWPLKSKTGSRRANPLNWIAAITAVSVCLGIYDVCSKPQLNFPVIALILLGAIFLFSFFQELRVAWLISVITYVSPLLNVGGNRDFLVSASLSASGLLRMSAIAVWLVGLVYLFYIRKSYLRFLHRGA
jgi:hypothetical protein